jgi:MFS family permease
MQTGNTFQGTILGIRGEIDGFTLAQIGAVGAGFWAGVIIGSLRAAAMIRRVGHIRTFAAFGAIAGAAPLVHLLMVDPYVWIAARALTGFCFAGMFIVIESWLNAGASSENRGQVLSVYGMTGLLAGISGQLLLSCGGGTEWGFGRIIPKHCCSFVRVHGAVPLFDRHRKRKSPPSTLAQRF